MRKLQLHTSALNDDEYALYTNSLKDIALADEEDQDHDDLFYEQLTIGVREARAWLRGRYTHIPAAKIDAILRYFSPDLNQTDTLSGGEFFAALRLVVHAEGGKEIDRALAFVQAHPTDPPTSTPPYPYRKSADLPPVQPQRAHSEAASSFSSSNAFAPANANPFPPTPSPSSSSHNPFKPKPLPPRSDDGTSRLPPLPPRKPAPPPVPHLPPPRRSTTLLNNPTSRSISPAKPTNPVSPPNGHVAPPPHPKAVPHVTSTLMKQSLAASKVAQTLKKAEEQLERERILQVLKSSSGLNSTPKPRPPTPPRPLPTPSTSSYAPEDRDPPPLPKRRPLLPSPPMSLSSLEQVALATPPHPSNSYLQQYPTHGRLTRDPSPHKVLSTRSSPLHSPRRDFLDLPPGPPPPMHPDRRSPFGPSTSNADDAFERAYGPPKLDTRTTTTMTTGSSPTGWMGNGGSPTTRVFRSKSLHHPTPPPVPPPPRRKRPESIQVLPAPPPTQHSPSLFEVIDGESVYSATASTSSESTSAPLSRHMSLSTPARYSGHRRETSTGSTLSRNHLSNSSQGSEVGSSPLHLGHLQRTLATLQPRFEALQPKLDKARYKAEAGLSRRGFVRGAVGVAGHSGNGPMIYGKTAAELEKEEEEGLVRYGGGRYDDFGGMDGEDGGFGVDVASRSDDEEGEGGRGTIRGRGWRSVGAGGGVGQDPFAEKEKDGLDRRVGVGEGWRKL
ncbi:hypothetical protein BDN72DRAFT_962980 [Pluteus cervinus]|uniref:Uncharacterized protein n=1 Tax=Pluteus cervinus TaxID=181527 RepID=A0ACD3AGK1_9AGAR|nr:hypothetical protein BDN72DRAFT_962980 [Pluteus cervinus]